MSNEDTAVASFASIEQDGEGTRTLSNACVEQLETFDLAPCS